VVLETSPIKSLRELEGEPVAFANPYAVAGYYLPMDLLTRSGVTVAPVFVGNQEASIGQLLSMQVAAAGVNDQMMADFCHRRRLKYRVLAESEPYFDLAVMASPRVSAADGEKVRQAFVAMAQDPEGRDVLERVAKSLALPQARGFVAADDRDYNNYRRFFRRTQVPLNE
jgi:phosphonate transport system substrate-binding protein